MISAVLAVLAAAAVGLSVSSEESDAALSPTTIDFGTITLSTGDPFTISHFFPYSNIAFDLSGIFTANYSWAEVMIVSLAKTVVLAGTAPAVAGTYNISYTSPVSSTAGNNEFSQITVKLKLVVTAGPQPQTISFNANGGVGSIASQQVMPSVYIDLPWQGMTNAGYFLSGWRAGNASTGTLYDLGQSYRVTASTVMYAQWSSFPSGYWIDNNLSIMVKSGQQFSVKPDVTAAGSPWYKMANATGIQGPGNIIIDSAPSWLNFTRDAQTKTYTVSGTPPSPGAYLVQIHSNYLPNNTKIAFVITVYPAAAQQTTYTISFDNNGGSGSFSPWTGIPPNNAIILPGQAFERPGYTQIGWETTVNGAPAMLFLGGAMTVTGNMIMKARWVANPHVVVLNANGGTSSIEPYIAYTDGQITLPSSGLTRAGYTLEGWFLANAPDAIYSKGYIYTIGDNVTFFAYWVPLGATTTTATVNANQGTGTYTQNVEPGKSIVLPVYGIQRSSFVLMGFDPGPGVTSPSYQPGSVYDPTSVPTIYAIWGDATLYTYFTVTFSTAGGSGSFPPQQVLAGGTATAPLTVPIKPGSIFRTWKVLNGPEWTSWSTVITEDITLEAQYDLHFSLDSGAGGLTLGIIINGIFAGSSSVNWGDGTVEVSTSTFVTHTYGAPMSGTITVTSTVGGTDHTSSRPFAVSDTPPVPPPPVPPVDDGIPIMLILAIIIVILIIAAILWWLFG